MRPSPTPDFSLARAILTYSPPLSPSQAARFWHGRVTTTGNESHKGAPPQGLLLDAR